MEKLRKHYAKTWNKVVKSLSDENELWRNLKRLRCGRPVADLVIVRSPTYRFKLNRKDTELQDF